jgi:hypothetical protein
MAAQGRGPAIHDRLNGLQPFIMNRIGINKTITETGKNILQLKH